MKYHRHYLRRNMKRLALLSAICLLQICPAFHYIHVDQYGWGIAYDVTLFSKCRTQEDRFRTILGIKLSDCVRECGLRLHCVALSYSRQLQMCSLFTTTNMTNGGYIDSGECICISITEVKIEKEPCGNSSYGQVCDMRLKDCKYEECLNASLNNGVVLGNQKRVGNKIRYKCNHGYRDRNGVQSAVCQENGAWNVTANCTRVCNDLPTINNGTVTLDKINGNMHTDAATVTCDTGYLKSVDTINCTVSGNWENVTCDPVDCGNPPPIANGNIALNTGTMYMNTATVTCETSFKTDASTITCTASGSWETAKCKDCYIDTVRNYSGTKNITETGYACERWDNHTGKYDTDAQHIPESSLSEIVNYCRNPTNNTRWPLWCFSANSDIEWEFCGIQRC